MGTYSGPFYYVLPPDLNVDQRVNIIIRTFVGNLVFWVWVWWMW